MALPLGLMLLTACGGRSEDAGARGLLDGAAQAFDARDYSLATQLLDSLQKTFPAETAIQREALALRPKIIEQATLLKISTNDSLMALDQVTAEQTKKTLRWIKEPRMVEGFHISPASYSPDFMNRTGIQARVSEIGEFYIVSSANPQLGHTSVALGSGTSEAATPAVPYDGESNYRVGSGEIITFSPQQSDTIGSFALRNRGSALTLTFRGKGRKTVKLTPAQVNGIADAYAYSRAITQARHLAAERRKLEAMLQVARNQMARTATLDETGDSGEK